MVATASILSACTPTQTHDAASTPESPPSTSAVAVAAQAQRDASPSPAIPADAATEHGFGEIEEAWLEPSGNAVIVNRDHVY